MVTGKIGLQQRVLPSYRSTFFDMLAGVCSDGLGVFAGKPLAIEEISYTQKLSIASNTEAQNIHFSDPSTSFYICWQKNIIAWLKSFDPKILILEANPRYLSSRLAIQWMHSRSRPVIGWGLGAPPISGSFAGIRRWERYSFLHSLDAIIAYSKKGAQEYKALGLSDQQIFIAPNAVTPKPVNPLPERTNQFSERPSILFVGRLQTRKRIDILLSACASLDPDIQPNLTIIGDGPVRSNLEEVASQIYPRTVFTGAKQGNELDSYFDQADLFVLPGTGGLAVQQAMAHGLPVIVAQGDGTQDALVTSQNGWIIPSDDNLYLGATLKDALSDPSRLRQMGAESYRIVSQDVNLEKMVEVFENALESVV